MCTTVQDCHSLSARNETEKQTKGYPRARFQGYTVADGGRDAAERAYEAYVKSNQSEHANPSNSGGANEEHEEQSYLGKD